ncbi:cation:proton antiporter [uncultured Muribaculum sp.]|uniref:cation:proton antiporter n=1 Tax=uncultured Muribaculum sp. TaxID=1918613 RepID=UPI0025A96726|nr:cation:proton antiporter [uncultured Muribaculum sp.]
MTILSATMPIVTDPVLIFFIVLVIILLAPILLNRLKIPHIIGMIVAGIAIGPYGIALLNRDASFEIFGQVGIIYLMFLAGIEIDMFHLKKNLRRGLGFGIYTFVIPMVLGTLTSVWLLGFNWLTSVLLASMYASHTLIAYPIVSRFGLTKSPAVIITIAGTIVTVLGALIVLAIIVGIYQTGTFNTTEVLWLLTRLVIYCIIVVYSYPRLTRWFFKKYNDNITQFIYVLAMVFLASVSAKMIGLESVLGAFYAGLVLNRYIPNTSGLMNRIEFVGNAIFIPYFLIGVGMLINVKVLFASWTTLYVATVMSVVATLCKWVAAWITQRVYKMDKIDRSIMFGLSNAQAAATLAAVMIGFKLGIFNEDVLNGTIVMILFTCTVSSIVTERAAQRIKLNLLTETANSDKTGMSKIPMPGNYKKNRTLITVSNPVTAPALVDFAVLMQLPFNKKDSELFALHVRNDNSAGSRAIGRNSLDVAISTAASADVKVTAIERYDLNVVTGLVNTIEERDITDVIMGMHRKTNVIDSFFGAKIEQLLKATNKMIVINRCFIPVSTVTRIVVYVPEKAQFETGFARWVCSIGSLASQIGCRAIFCCHPDTWPYIRQILRNNKFDIRAEKREMNDWDDFLLLANRILDDDLFIVVSARRTSVSFNSQMDELPGFLQRYFARNNLVVLYPSQFGNEVPVTSTIDPLSNDITAPPSELWIRIASVYRRIILFRKRFTQRKRTKKIDL